MLFVPELRILPDASDELPIPRLLNQLTVLLPALLSPLWRSNWRSFAAAGVEIKFHFQAKVLAFSFTLFFAYPPLLLLVFFFSLFAAIDNCATRTVDIPGKSTTATTTQDQLVINHFGSATVCVCVQLCVCVWKQRKLTKNINYVHEGRNLMRCRCRTEIEAALLFLQSAAAETREKKNTERKAQEKQQKGSTEKTKTISFMPAPFLPGN